MNKLINQEEMTNFIATTKGDRQTCETGNSIKTILKNEKEINKMKTSKENLENIKLHFNVLQEETYRIINSELEDKEFSKDVKYVIATIKTRVEPSDSLTTTLNLKLVIDNFIPFKSKELFDRYLAEEMNKEMCLTFEVKDGKIVTEDN